ncbi:MAG: hypothetical protein AB8B81_14340 [Halioglobus sp.]
MKYAVILALLLISEHTLSSVLVGKWVYDSERILAELHRTSNTPANVMKCFELKVCGNMASFEYTSTHWRQRLDFSSGDDYYESEFVEYQVLEETAECIVISTLVEGEKVEVKFSIIDNNHLSYITSLGDFQWIEYLSRAH